MLASADKDPTTARPPTLEHPDSVPEPRSSQHDGNEPLFAAMSSPESHRHQQGTELRPRRPHSFIISTGAPPDSIGDVPRQPFPTGHLTGQGSRPGLGLPCRRRGVRLLLYFVQFPFPRRGAAARRGRGVLGGCADGLRCIGGKCAAPWPRARPASRTWSAAARACRATGARAARARRRARCSGPSRRRRRPRRRRRSAEAVRGKRRGAQG